MQVVGRGEATVINSFPESSSATRPIYESHCVVLMFLGETPAPTHSELKGTPTKMLRGAEPSLESTHGIGRAKKGFCRFIEQSTVHTAFNHRENQGFLSDSQRFSRP